MASYGVSGPIAILCGLSLALPARADDRVADGNLARGMITPEAQRAIDQGLDYLAKTQAANGSWGSGNEFRGNVAITSLGGLAFLAGGHQPGRGKYGKVVARAVDYVLTQKNDKGLLSNPNFQFNTPMYNHGFATLFLAEVYGMGTNKHMNDRLKTAIDLAVKLIISAQHKSGGWRYDPQPHDADISVTICQIMALRAARNAGFSVPKATAENCIKYVKKCQDNSGGFGYQGAGDPGFARTAAGVVALYSAGVYDGDAVKKGLDFLLRYKPGAGRGAFQENNNVFYYYGHYYAAQAMWTAGGRYWKDWFPAVRENLLRGNGHRQAGGNWADNQFCTHYYTAMALIVLQIPNNYLPIFQR